MQALSQDDNNSILVDMDLCIGCGLCVRYCKDKAILMEAKPDFQSLPENWDAFVAEMIKAREKMAAQKDQSS